MFTRRFQAIVLFSSQCRRLHKTHYDVLEVSRNCTRQDVRKAFIKLSKKYHPDIRQDKNAHNKYVKIVEAYKTLSEPNSRADYDLGLSNPDMGIYRSYQSTYSDFSHRREYYYGNNDSKSTSENYNTRYNPNKREAMTIFIVLALFVYISTFLKILNYENTMKKADTVNGKLYYEVKDKAIKEDVSHFNKIFDEKDA